MKRVTSGQGQDMLEEMMETTKDIVQQVIIPNKVPQEIHLRAITSEQTVTTNRHVQDMPDRRKERAQTHYRLMTTPPKAGLSALGFWSITPRR